MPVQVQGPDGNTYQFPDGTDKTAAISYFKKKGIGAKSAAQQAAGRLSGAGAPDQAPDPRDALTEIRPQRYDTPAHAVEDAFGNIGAGLLTVPLHPLQTAESVLRMTGPGILLDLLMGKKIAPLEMGESLVYHPVETIEGAIGQAAAFGGGEEAVKGVGVVGPITRGLVDTVKKAGGKIAESATGTGPKATAELVHKVRAGNEAADAYSSLRARIETARENALKIGNEKYNTVNSALDHIEADPLKTRKILLDTSETIPSAKEPPLVKEFDDRLNKMNDSGMPGGPITYDELQSFYSRLGIAISKGGLDPDTFHAYDTMHEAIGDEMQRIADSKAITPEVKYVRNGRDIDYAATESKLPPVKQGYVRLFRSESPTTGFSDVFKADGLKDFGSNRPPGKAYTDSLQYADYYRESYGPDAKTTYIDVPSDVAKSAKFGNGEYIIDDATPHQTTFGAQLTDARNYWRRMKQTFGKPLTQNDAATGVLRSTSPDLSEQDVVANRVRMLGSFDEAIPDEFARLEKAQEASKGAPKPAPGQTGKVSTEDITEAKAEKVHKTADYIRKRALTIGTFVTGYKALGAVGRAMMGDVDALSSLPGDVAEGIAVMGGMHGIANLLESPRVMRLLTNPTEADLAQIPPGLRGDLKPIVEAAQRKGIKVDSKLAALVGAVSNPQGPQTRKLQQTADDYRTTAQ